MSTWRLNGIEATPPPLAEEREGGKEGLMHSPLPLALPSLSGSDVYSRLPVGENSPMRQRLATPNRVRSADKVDFTIRNLLHCHEGGNVGHFWVNMFF